MSKTPHFEIHDLVQKLTDPSQDVQEMAIETLARLGRHAVPELRKLIPLKMCNQIAALARMGYPSNSEAIPDLVEELKYSGSFPPKEALISCTLRSIGVPVLAPIRKTLAEHPEVENWIGEVAWILQAFDRTHLEPLTEVLIKTLAVGLTRDLWFYTGLMKLLSRIGSPKAKGAIPILCSYYQAAWEDLSIRATDRKSEDLRNAIKATNEEIRISSISAISSFSPQDIELAIPILQKALNDPIPQIRHLAKLNLSRLGIYES